MSNPYWDGNKFIEEFGQAGLREKILNRLYPDQDPFANAIEVIDKERERADAAEKKLEVLVEAVDGFVTIDDTTGVSWTDSNPDSRGDLAAALRDAREKS